MSTLAVTHTLAALFVPIGIAGAAIAVLCALVTVFALARRAAGLAGGAAGVWIVGALLSSASSFADLWTPLFVSLGSLAAALVVGGMLRALVGSVSTPQEHAPQASVSGIRDPRTQPTRVTAAQVRPSSPVTDGIRVA